MNTPIKAGPYLWAGQPQSTATMSDANMGSAAETIAVHFEHDRDREMRGERIWTVSRYSVHDNGPGALCHIMMAYMELFVMPHQIGWRWTHASSY